MKIRNFVIGLALLAVLAASVFAVPAHAAAPAQEGSNGQVTRQVSVNGSGKVMLTPDMATIRIGVQSQSDKAVDALDKNNKQVEAVIKAIKDLKVEDKDVQTSNFSIRPEEQRDAQGKLTGLLYVVDNTVIVTVRDLSKLGTLLDTSVRSGANSIYGISFDVTDKSKAIAQARQMAVDDARSQAQELAKATGTELGKVLTISVNIVDRGETPFYGAAMDMAKASAVPVQAGQMAVNVEVNINYEIK
jgi:uncharacterized protein YggE